MVFRKRTQSNHKRPLIHRILHVNGRISLVWITGKYGSNTSVHVLYVSTLAMAVFFLFFCFLLFTAYSINKFQKVNASSDTLNEHTSLVFHRVQSIIYSFINFISFKQYCYFCCIPSKSSIPLSLVFLSWQIFICQ